MKNGSLVNLTNSDPETNTTNQIFPKVAVWLESYFKFNRKTGLHSLKLTYPLPAGDVFPFPRWDMLVPWRVHHPQTTHFLHLKSSTPSSPSESDPLVAAGFSRNFYREIVVIGWPFLATGKQHGFPATMEATGWTLATKIMDTKSLSAASCIAWTHVIFGTSLHSWNIIPQDSASIPMS